MLAEKRIDTSVYSQAEDGKTVKEGVLKPNEQNVKNRAREVTFQQHINRCVSCFTQSLIQPEYCQIS